MGIAGGWKLADMTACNLPEKAATGFTQVMQNMIGAKYIPVLYVGEQVVHGINHMIICKQTLAVSGAPEHLVTVVINNMPDSSDWSIVSINPIV